MPAPYSDNMYSLSDDSGEDESNHSTQPANPLSRVEAAAYDDDDALQALSPSDGYFHALNSSEAGVAQGTGISASGDHSPLGLSQGPMSSQVPHVPDVWVEDPSLQASSTAAGKAREAEQERRANNPSPPRRRRSPSPVASSPPRRQPHAPYVSIPPPQSLAGTSSSGPPFSPTHSRASASTSTTSGPATHHHRYTPSSSSRFTRSVYTPVAASIYSSDAPPAYTASPTSPSSPAAATAFSRATDAADYQTFSRSAMGRPTDETQPLMRHAPEDMGGPRDRDGDLDSDVPWHQRVSRYAPAALTWKRCRGILIAVVVVLGLWMLFGSSTVAEQPDGHGPSPPPAPGPPPDAPERYPHFNFGDIGFAGNTCGGNKHEYPVQELAISFNAKHILYVAQRVDKDHHRDGRTLQVSGDVVFRRQQADGPSGIVLEMVSNDETITPVVDFDKDGEHGQSLKITTPSTVPWSGADYGPCLGIRVTVWVPEDAALSTLEVGAVHLGIKLLDNLRMDVAKHAMLQSINGNVVAATTGDSGNNANLIHNGPPDFFKFNCRTIMVKTTSSNIQGSWPLLDYLSLESISGDIAAGVVPKEAGEETTAPAELQVQTTSGNIEVWEPVDKVHGSDSPTDLFPPRHYVLNVKSSSGNVKGALAFSKAANIQTTSGNTDVVFLPVLPASVATSTRSTTKYSLLETSTTSGTSHFTLNDPLWVELPDQLDVLPVLDSGAFLRVLQSYHRTLSANIRIDYPAAWEGDIHAKTTSGGLLVTGKDVRVIRMGGKWPGVGKDMLARKGHLAEGAGSDVSVDTTSGTIKILFPEN